MTPTDFPTLSRATYIVKGLFIHNLSGGGCPTEYWEERRVKEATLAKTVLDLMANDYSVSRTLQVVAFDLESGRCWDASKQVAQAMLDASETLTGDALAFVEHWLGTPAANEARGKDHAIRSISGSAVA